MAKALAFLMLSARTLSMPRRRSPAPESPSPVDVASTPSPEPAVSRYRIAHYTDRLWALYDGDELVAVTAYRKGAQEVLKRLTALEEEITVLHQQIAELTKNPDRAPSNAQAQPPPVSFQERINPGEQLRLIAAEDHPRYRITNQRASQRGR